MAPGKSGPIEGVIFSVRGRSHRSNECVWRPVLLGEARFELIDIGVESRHRRRRSVSRDPAGAGESEQQDRQRPGNRAGSRIRASQLLHEQNLAPSRRKMQSMDPHLIEIVSHGANDCNVWTFEEF
jgi:hypothetical protein